jgi:hypothetical protein
MATLRPDGTVEFGPDYHPDEAARAFWEGLAGRNPLLPRLRALEAAGAGLLEFVRHHTWDEGHVCAVHISGGPCDCGCDDAVEAWEKAKEGQA